MKSKAMNIFFKTEARLYVMTTGRSRLEMAKFLVFYAEKIVKNKIL